MTLADFGSLFFHATLLTNFMFLEFPCTPDSDLYACTASESSFWNNVQHDSCYMCRIAGRNAVKEIILLESEINFGSN
jgi:hypothetical protein